MTDTTTYDPSTGTVAEVNAYLAERPDEAPAVLAAEAQGKNRKGITEGPAAESEAGAAHEPEPKAPVTQTGGATFAEVTENDPHVDEGLGYVGTAPDPDVEVPLHKAALPVSEAASEDDGAPGYTGVSPERERTGLADKGLSLQSVLGLSAAPDAAPES